MSDSRDLVPVHGGLDAPVDRVVPLNERSAFLSKAAGLPAIEVSNADLSTVYRLSDGALSPLEGPMRADEWNRVLDDEVVISKGDPYAWTIPLALPVTDAEAGSLAAGGGAAIKNEAGEIVAILEDVDAHGVLGRQHHAPVEQRVWSHRGEQQRVVHGIDDRTPR